MNRKIFKRQWLVPSHTDIDKTWKVSEKHTGEFVCSCPHNIFRKLTCDHIKEVKYVVAYQEEIEKIERRIAHYHIERVG